MEQTTTMSERNYYLKGNWRHVFWGVTAFIIFSYFGQALLNMQFSRMISAGGTKSMFLLLGLQNLVLGICWMLIYLAYGLSNRIKLFKVLFIVRAGLQVLWIIRNTIGNGYVQFFLTAGNAANMLVSIATFIYISLNLFDIAFFIIIAVSRHSSPILKAGSILSAAIAVVGMAYTLAMLFFANNIAQIYGVENFGTIISTASYVMTILNFISYMLFFGAMSYSRIRQ